MDEFGNTTTLSVVQQQYYINLAKSLGASQADIDSFIHNNGANDLGRIVSALGLSPSATPSASPGAGTGTTSYAASIINSAPEIPDQRTYDSGGFVGPPASAYAVPSPQSGGVGSLTVASADDGRLSGSGGGGPAGPLSVSVGAPMVLPAAGVPTWAIVLAAVALIYVFMERK